MRLIFAEVAQRAQSQGKMVWILEEIVNEVLEEVAGEKEDYLAEYLLMTSQIMRWAATGEQSDLPEEMRERVLELTVPPGNVPEVDAMIAHQ